jgi:hypothetical protein
VVDPFLAEEKAWEYVNIIVSGSRNGLGFDTVLVHAPSDSACNKKNKNEVAK